MATLVAGRPGLIVCGVARVAELDVLSKHLLVNVEDAGRPYAVLNVHFIRPIGRGQRKHAEQLAAIRVWAEALEQRTPDTVVVVLGDFNDTGPALLPMCDSLAATGGAPTHLAKKAFDRIFTTGALRGAEVVRPPYPKRPNDLLKAAWTDHFLLRATVDR